MDKPKKRNLVWLDTLCQARSDDDLCRKRQFQTASGPTCASGHGGAPGRVMTRGELATWVRRFEDGELDDQFPSDAALDESAGLLKPKSKHAGFAAAVQDLHTIQTTASDGALPLKVGDVVMLKSGGVKMTVQGISAKYGTVTCIWSNQLGSIQMMDIKHDVLMYASDGEED